MRVKWSIKRPSRIVFASRVISTHIFTLLILKAMLSFTSNIFFKVSDNTSKCMINSIFPKEFLEVLKHDIIVTYVRI